MALGPDVGAAGSEGGHGYGWWKRQHCFTLSAPTAHVLSRGVGFEGIITGECEWGDWSEEGLRRTEHMGENVGSNPEAPVPPGNPIRDYNVPSDVEGVDGTQDSTMRMTFPKVSTSLP